MTWSYPGIIGRKELVYTQTLGFQPDVVLLTFNLQTDPIAKVGTVAMGWGIEAIALPNCLADFGTAGLTPDGRHMMLRLFDRRIFWQRAASISGEYNSQRAGSLVASRAMSLRGLATILFTALGETADVSILPTDVYPPVSWQCEDVVEAAQNLLEENGFTVSLGYGSEQPTVVRLGTGLDLPDDNKFIGSTSVNDKTPPRYLKNCFAESVAQVRLKLEAVGRDTDTDEWVPIDDLPYTPGAGWGATLPYSLPGLTGLTDEQQQEANGYVRRAYRVMGFADGTWNFPDGSGSVPDLSYILPLQNRLIDTEDIRPDSSRRPYRVYGSYYKDEKETGQPPIPGGVNTDIFEPVVSRQLFLDGENGIVFFDEPIFKIVSGQVLPADLWLECSVQVRSTTNGAWAHYEKINDVNINGIGYFNVTHRQRAETIVEYDASHDVVSYTTNQATLDAIAASWVSTVAGLFVDVYGKHVVYSIPKLSLRCDGAIKQVQHILTCGDASNPVNRTIASRNMEFDRHIPSKAQRLAHLRGLLSSPALQTVKSVTQQQKDNND